MLKLRQGLVRNVRSFIADTRGATSIEYAVMASGIALAIVTTLSLLSENIRVMYDTIVTATLR